MAVAHDATSSTNGDGGSFTFSKTNTGSNLYLAVVVSHLVSAGRSVSGVTYNSVAMGLLGGITVASTYRVEAWGLKAPATGANNVVVTMGGPPNSVAIGASSYTGVDQTTPTSDFTTATGSSANPAVTVPSTSGDLVMAGCVDAGSTSLTVNQTLLWNLILGTDTPRGGGSRAVGAASVTTTFTGSNTNWACLGFNLKAAGGAATPNSGFLSLM